MKLFLDFEKEWNNLKSPYKTEIKYFQLQNVKIILRNFFNHSDILTSLLLQAQKFHQERLNEINKSLSRLSYPIQRKKYGHNPDLITRDEEIYMRYVILREKGLSPDERISILSKQYPLSPSTIKDIVQGKTKRKKKLG